MEWHQILQAVLSLVFVIGLLFLTLWIFKFCEQKGLRCKFFKDLKSNRRIDILERRNLDARSQVVLIRADNTEYLLLVSAGSSLLLSSTPVSGQNNHD